MYKVPHLFNRNFGEISEKSSKKAFLLGLKTVQRIRPSNVEQCGAMWSNVEQCGAMWDSQPQCGVMWSDVGRAVQCIHIISNKIYRTIEFDQKFGNNAPMPHVVDSKLFILWQHQPSAGVSSLSLLSSLCCCRCVGAVKSACYHLGLAGCFIASSQE